jgi:hypothetical protein
MLTTSKTTTSGMFPVLSYTSVTGRYMAAMLACLREPRRHCFCGMKGAISLGPSLMPKTAQVAIQCPPNPSTPELGPFRSKDMGFAALDPLDALEVRRYGVCAWILTLRTVVGLGCLSASPGRNLARVHRHNANTRKQPRVESNLCSCSLLVSCQHLSAATYLL